ncbi:uncharacterized protein MEPE_04732 [Melanopsichium pennsylvanicum]|uniref:Uncharacterized protein n=2 Tax=Melanopsichium pennsylvanicum TaxID=63383 RepID=A0AAJ5C6Z5_9BASI|nr:conserved hypothetical protein [Melanopsichium pennsylvanicum 4]SNX86023.1 uncharacterized protein MEPE_04732 [Melanopsichium pennsylvanicum]
MVTTRSATASSSSSYGSTRKSTSTSTGRTTSIAKTTLSSKKASARKATETQQSKGKTKSKSKGSSKFPYDFPYSDLCLRTCPHLYRTGVGEQGVLMVEPYKSEILPHWRFKDPHAATDSSTKIYSMFRSYVEEGDFAGADMARKFIQMGYTRARRYANRKGGKKYIYDSDDDSSAHGYKNRRTEIKRLEEADQDPDKVEAARIFKTLLDEKVWTNDEYVKMRQKHIEWAKNQPTLQKGSAEVQEALLPDPAKEREVRKW